MESLPNPATTTISVFTRHSPNCSKRDDRTWRRCNCRKSLYIYEDGKDRMVSAKTRSWEQAERLAQLERDKRDPAKIELLKIAAEKAAAEKTQADSIAAAKAKNITVEEACGRWIAAQKFQSPETAEIYDRAARRIKEWAQAEHIKDMHEVTADILDAWRGRWATDAERKFDRIGQTSQSTFQGRVKQFFRWAVKIGFIDRDPSASMASLPKSDVRTMPLTPPQFEQLLATIEPFTLAQVGQVRDLAGELRALFLLQRWTGLRILDCLMLPRTGLRGNRLTLKTKKNGARIDGRVIPDVVANALQSLPPDRPNFRPAYFLWTEGRKWEGLSTKWGDIIRPMNSYLDFKDEEGQPMAFHSHMLRDTYAVEMLLAGVALEDVSRLLTHTSIQTTERYYARWVQARREQLEEKAVAAMKKQGVTFTL